MVRHLAWFLALLIFGSAGTAAELDTPATRHAAAQRYAQIADVGKLMRDAVDSITLKMPEASRDTFRALMTKHVRTSVIQAAVLTSMEKNFTTRELNALAAFYGSEVGRSAMAKFGTYMADVMPIIQAELMRAISELKQEGALNVKPNDT